MVEACQLEKCIELVACVVRRGAGFLDAALDLSDHGWLEFIVPRDSQKSRQLDPAEQFLELFFVEPGCA